MGQPGGRKFACLAWKPTCPGGPKALFSPFFALSKAIVKDDDLTCHINMY